jgi:hypothetical protein
MKTITKLFFSGMSRQKHIGQWRPANRLQRLNSERFSLFAFAQLEVSPTLPGCADAVNLSVNQRRGI